MKNLTNYVAHDLRLRLGLTQAQFAELLGCSINAVEKWEQGQRQPNAEFQAKIDAIRNSLTTG
jgi:putative transcriptional regulator